MRPGLELWRYVKKIRGIEMDFVEAKTLLRKVQFDKTRWFGIDYIMNLYKGCNHGCIYCDSRSDRYFIKDFDKVRGKVGIETILSKELRYRKAGIIDIGAMSDTYNLFEKEYCLTRKALKIIRDYGFGISITTKSNLIERDADILEDISNRYAAIIKFSITCANDRLASSIEPNVVPTSYRLKAMKKLSERGIYVGVLITPILPFVTDDVNNIKSIVRLAHEHGAKFVYTKYGMTLSSGQREYYYKKIDDMFDGMSSKYQYFYGKEYSCAVRNKCILQKVFIDECNNYGLLYNMEDIIKGNRICNLYKQLSLFDS